MNKAQLIDNIRQKKSFLCVGLDTDLKKIPQHLLSEEDPLFAFNKAIIDATAPYCVAVNPGSGEIYVTDAKNYASSGSVLCYSKEGKLLWKATTGDIPACIAFCKK